MLSIVICTDIKISLKNELPINRNRNDVSLTLVKDELESMKSFSSWKMLIDSQKLIGYNHFYSHREFRYHCLTMTDHRTVHRLIDESNQLLTE
jgi:hypothetical protein